MRKQRTPNGRNLRMEGHLHKEVIGLIESLNPAHSLYAVYLKIDRDIKLQIGRLGSFSFKKGTYVYVGSAKRNITARINRHKKIDKPFRWHFDYLRPHGEIIKIITYENSIGECELAEKIRKMHKGAFPVKGFGASDCRCFSHLIYFHD